MVEWRIYYGDGSVFDNTEGSPSEAPATNVQLIVCKNEVNSRNLYYSWDWYYYKAGEWRGADIHGVIDQLLTDKNGDFVTLKQGRTIRDDIYDDIIKKGFNDNDFKDIGVINKLHKPIRKGVDE